jgi:hypothetical protein
MARTSAHACPSRFTIPGSGETVSCFMRPGHASDAHVFVEWRGAPDRKRHFVWSVSWVDDAPGCIPAPAKG